MVLTAQLDSAIAEEITLKAKIIFFMSASLLRYVYLVYDKDLQLTKKPLKDHKEFR